MTTPAVALLLSAGDRPAHAGKTASPDGSDINQPDTGKDPTDDSQNDPKDGLP